MDTEEKPAIDECCFNAAQRTTLVQDFENRRKSLVRSLNEIENIIQKLKDNPQMERHYREIQNAINYY